MTRKSICEYAKPVQKHYPKASKKVMLDKFCRTTDYNCKAPIRLLGHPPSGSNVRRGRKAEHCLAIVQPLKML